MGKLGQNHCAAAARDDRERRKRLWLDPIKADLSAPGAREIAGQFRVSLRLSARIAGFIVNLDSFLDAGYVYASQSGIGRYIKNENGDPVSARQVRRCINFLAARGHLRVERRRGTWNLMFPIYRAAKSEDTVSSDRGNDVRGVRPSCPPKLVLKPITETQSPHTPQSVQDKKLVKLPDNTISFDEFYRACVRPERDRKGPALACWNKLTERDRSAIGDLTRSNGCIYLDGVYVCTWLTGRCWEMVLRLRPLAPYSDEWCAERQRQIDAGLSVKFMDRLAAQGEGYLTGVSDQ